ncbi:MAG: hypothetical protein WAT23_01320 [Chromatiaceae bacterium]
MAKFLKGGQPMKLLALLTLGLFLSLCLLGGCGTTREVQYTGPQADGWDHKPVDFKTVVIAVKSEVPETEEAKKQLIFALEVEFRYKKKSVVKSGGDIEVTVVIQSLNDVPRESRVWLGSLAGSATLHADVRIKGKTIKPFSFAVETISRGAETTDDFLTGKGGSTQDMLERTAELIVAELIP